MEEDFIICQVCGEQVVRVYGAHLKKHGMNSKEYKEKYPGQPLMSKRDLKETTKNSGQHMKLEKYKKIFSDKIKGEKNPNHKSKTTEQQRKERSPFSIEFHDNEEQLIEFRKKAFTGRNLDTRLEYYLNKGYDLEVAEHMLKKRQTTFTLEKCVQKYGEEEGKKVYTNRQERWQKSLLANGNLKYGYSKISQELFFKILDAYIIEDRKHVYFATKNNEYRLNKTVSAGIWIYDFTDIKNKKIIEYNGDQYHANPLLYESGDHPHPFRKNITSSDIWKKDKEKIVTAEEQGFKILTIWDSEFKKDKIGTLKKCLDFLNI